MNGFAKKILLASLLAFGTQVFAALPCEGTIYFKLPDGWKSAYVVAGGNGVRMTASEFDGWLSLDASKVGGNNNATAFNIEETGKNDCNSGHCATGVKIDTIAQMGDMTGFNCNDIKNTGEVWIQVNPDPDKHTTPDINGVPPGAKYFYIFLPNNAIWKSSIPMMSVDGKAGEPMSAVPDRCGWFYKRYIDEEPPSNVLIYRDDDETMAEAIGMGGDWEEADTPTPIDLKTMFELFDEKELYFVADVEFADESNPQSVGWTTTDPGVTGDCGYELFALIYDTDASLHGAFTCAPDWFDGQTDDEARANACFYSGVPYNVVSSSTGTVPCIGITQGMVTDILDKDKKKPVLTAAGKKCFGSQADEAFTAMFNSTPGVNETYCFDLPFSQTDDGKYEFDSDNYQSPGATVAGGFYPAEEPPAADKMLSERLEDAEFKRKAEGPVFFCADYNNQMTSTPEGFRTIHAKEGVPISDLICNGPGWDGGIDCDGLFVEASEFSKNSTLTQAGRKIQSALGVTWEGDGWGWACPTMGPIGWTYYKDGTENRAGVLSVKNQVPAGGVPRWTSGVSDAKPLANAGRNQHFCFESHANFRYKKGLRFSFRGDDDIWVYIDNKLAVDLGGTHLAAPGYVDLDKFVGASGAWVVGQTYDIDIFFCDRRTTMSNVRINTNMFIQQTSGLKKDIVSKAGDVENYKLKYCVASGCGSFAGTQSSKCYEGTDLCTYLAANGKTVNYSITNKKGDLVYVNEAELAANDVYFGGIDLTDRCDPKIDKTKLTGLTANTYYLVAKVDGKTEKFQFKVTGSLEIANKTSYAQDEDGNRLGTYEITKLALASMAENPTRIPLYISSVMDQGDSLLFDVSSAVGQLYTLEVIDVTTNQASKDVTLEVKDASGAFVPWTGTQRNIGDSGVDTVYASIPMSLMKNTEQTYAISVAGRTYKDTVTFFAPKLVFVSDSTSTDQISGDLDGKERWTGSLCNFYLLALAPVQGTTNFEPCGDRCNFSLAVGSMTSTGLVVDTAGLHLENGRAMISMYSQKEYRIAGNGAASNAATLAITGPNPLIKAEFTPLYFRNRPIPAPMFADIFDVHGKNSSSKMHIDAPYFSMEQEYLDGIADSLVIYYNRPFSNNPKSLPDSIVVMWDDEDDFVVLKRKSFQDNMVCGDAANLPDTLCLGRISVGGVHFSKDVKTANPNAKVTSFVTFVDRGRKVENRFPANINDRVAPIVLSASITKKNSKELVTLKMSEPVQLIDSSYKKKGLDFYLFKADGLEGKDRFAQLKADEIKIEGDEIKVSFDTKVSKFPQIDDYVRLRSDKLIWRDKAEPVAGTDDSLRSKEDCSYNWNSPTAYDADVRLPSPWVVIEKGDSSEVKQEEKEGDEEEDEEEKKSVKKPSFRVVLTGPFTFDIVFVDAEPGKTKSYAVMDLMGGVIKQGKTVGGTRISVKNSGSYIVRVGRGYQKVDIK